MASSRVGVRIRPRMPRDCCCFWSRSISGRTNASVLPVPVCAVATTSRPASAGSMVCACTGVGVVKLCFARLLCRRAESGKSLKLFIQLCEEENQRANYQSWGGGCADLLPDFSIANTESARMKQSKRIRRGDRPYLAGTRPLVNVVLWELEITALILFRVI